MESVFDSESVISDSLFPRSAFQVFLRVVEEGEGAAFNQPGEAEEQEQEYFQDHRPIAGAGGDAGHDEDCLEGEHTVAAEAVNLVAELLALGHRVARLGKLEDAVDGDGEEEERRASGVDVVRYLDGDLEESDRRAVGNPADLAGEEDDAEAGDAGYGGYQIVRGVVADVGYQYYAGGHQHAYQRRALIVCGGEAPPPVFAGMHRYAGGKDRQNRQDNAKQSAQVADPEVHPLFFGCISCHNALLFSVAKYTHKIPNCVRHSLLFYNYHFMIIILW